MKYRTSATPCETLSYGEVEDYTVNITNSFTATVASSDKKAQLLGHEEAGVRFETYPKPVTDQLVVSISEKGSFTATVYNLSGKVLKSAKADRSKLEIDVAELKEGINFIKVAGERDPHTFKFVKE